MKTLPVMIRVEPKKWKKLQDEAREQDLTTPQLIRRIIDDWLETKGWNYPIRGE